MGDAVRALINAERQRAEDFGSIAENARAQMASRDAELQRLRAGHHLGHGAKDSTAASSTTGVYSGVHSSSASSAAAAAAAALSNTLGISEDDSTLSPSVTSK